jgi:hypothetical protein
VSATDETNGQTYTFHPDTSLTQSTEQNDRFHFLESVGDDNKNASLIRGFGDQERPPFLRG